MDYSVLILILSFGILIMLNVPIAISIGCASILTMLTSIPAGPAVTTIAQQMAAGINSFALLAIPFFVLSGILMGQGGIARRLINFARVVVGIYPGGLAYVNVLACMLFGAISGSAVAATSAIGGFMIPAMEKEGYDRDFTTAVTVTASTTGLLIPPSNILIVYSLASGGLSIAALFIAGYIPGFLVGLGLITVSAVIARIRHYPVGEKVSGKAMLKALLDALPGFFMVVLVIGGIIGGIFTATEASAIAVFYAFILSVLIYREVRFADLPGVLLKAVEITAIVMLLIGTSKGMSWIMSYENIPQNISAALIGLTSNKIVILLLINLMLLIVGTFMDITPAVLIFTPIFLPVVRALGITPLHFGIIMILNLTIGLCTPPVGSVLFVGASIGRTSILRLIRPLLPLYAAMIVVLLLVTFIPGLSTWLPSVLGY